MRRRDRGAGGLFVGGQEARLRFVEAFGSLALEPAAASRAPDGLEASHYGPSVLHLSGAWFKPESGYPV